METLEASSDVRRPFAEAVRGTFAAHAFWLALALGACSKAEPPAAGPAASPAPAAAPAPPASAPPSTAKNPAAARKLITSGAVVLDVRTAEEFAEEHLPNAVNIPVGELPKRLDEVAGLAGNDKARPVVVYCASGDRAGKATAQLGAAGYSNVVNGGGLDDLL